MFCDGHLKPRTKITCYSNYFCKFNCTIVALLWRYTEFGVYSEMDLLYLGLYTGTYICTVFKKCIILLQSNIIEKWTAFTVFYSSSLSPFTATWVCISQCLAWRIRVCLSLPAPVGKGVGQQQLWCKFRPIYQ